VIHTVAANNADRIVSKPIFALAIDRKAAPTINIDIGKSAKKSTDAQKCIGFTFSGKTPIAMSANESRTKMKAPILPSIFSRKKVNSPNAKSKAKIPPAMRPKLNSVALIPVTTPKSLRASSAQLNCGYEATASNMNVKVTNGVIMPQIPDILSQTLFSETITVPRRRWGFRVIQRLFKSMLTEKGN
jgi:hypothetical protein